MTEELEKVTQAEIIKYLLFRKALVLRVNSVVARIGKRFIRSVIQCGEEEDKGVSDIIGCTKYGKFFAIEVKRRGEHATPEQVRFVERVKSKQAISLVAFTLDDVIAGMEEYL